MISREATESLRINSEAFGEVRKDVDKFRNETSEISIVLEEKLDDNNSSPRTIPDLLDELKMKREKFLKCLAEFNERYPLFGYGYFNENIDIIIKKAEKRLSEES